MTTRPVVDIIGTVLAGAAHGHAIADVTGLQPALDAKQAAGSYSLTSHDHAGIYQPAGSYAAASHTHAIADVISLQAALDGKQASGSYAAASHSHAVGDITNLAAQIPNASYRSLLDCTASHVAARAAGTYWLGQGQPAGVTGTGTLYSPNLIYIDSADYPTVAGLTAKLRLKVTLAVNDVAPTGNYTFGLYPVTTPATSGGAALRIWAMGTVVASSTVLFTAPAADSAVTTNSAEFALPANGLYVIGFINTITPVASSHMHISALLQMRNS